MSKMIGSPGLSYTKSTQDLSSLELTDLDAACGIYDKPVATTSNWLPTPKDVTQPGFSENSMIVMKFGGTSVGNAGCLTRVASIVRKALPSRPILVLSAMGKTTNNLLAAASKALESGEVDASVVRATHESCLKELGISVPASVSTLLDELERLLNGVALLREISMQTRDRVVSFGERLSVRTFEAVFNATKADPKEPDARFFDSWDIGMKTTSGAGSSDSAFSEVQVLDESYTEILHSFKPLQSNYSYVPVVTGYIAHDSKGVITTLGRDGSDLTATIIGASVRAAEVQIWKDVSGIQSMDPRVAPAAKPVNVLTFEEAAELSTFGAKVVHPAAVLPAWIANVPMSVRNSMAPDLPGTRILPELTEKDCRDGRVAAISSKSDITMIVIKSSRMLGQHGFLAHVFGLFNKFEASVDVIATSEVTVSLTLDQGYKSVDLVGLESALKEVAKVIVLQDMAMLTLICAKKDSTHVLKESFSVFDEMGVEVEMVSHGASNVNVTFVLPGDKLLPASRKLHEVFFER
mmetsp:Transcript_101106/g.179455  ORF Transcript_101106/g.179455 Transcript_101106/m.179455 type:complete len:522 (+) Transcript_101106:49-1614(+)